MANDNGSLAILKEAFNAGYEAFKTVMQNDKGIYNNPANPYTKGSLPYKEFERGYNWGHHENKTGSK